MNQPLPRSAFFLPTLSGENSGVDFLGLRQANLDMMADLIPGTNNVTPYIRPFSILSWIFWKFHNLCERSGTTEPNSEDIRLFRERIEVLFTWGARLADAPNIPGKQADPPSSSGDAVPLTFEAWKRVQTSTSLIAALWYGPASKTVTGLGFLEPFKAGFFRTSGKGVALAEALDAVLRTSLPLYRRTLDTLEPVIATADDARALWTLWGVFSPTDTERQVFRRALFDANSVGDYTTPLGRRSSTIALAKENLAHAPEPISADEVRRGMFFSMSPDGNVYPVPEGLELARAKWIILQVRQLQRLALETLLSWCEQKIIGGTRDTSTLTTQAEHLFRSESFGFSADDNLANVIAKLDAQIVSLDQFVTRGSADELFSPFALMERIESDFDDENDRVAVVSFYALFLCGSFASCFNENERSAIAIGDSSRLSLYHLRKRLIALGNVPLKQAIQFVLEAMVISQHFATAVNRFDGQNQRLRLSIEEGGLISLVGKPWEPTVTEDRLPTILKLAADCGLLPKTPEGRFHQ